MKTQEMLMSHPKTGAGELRNLAQCIEACMECAEICGACADACLGEEKIQMLGRCIRIDLDCADICQTTARVLGRQTFTDKQLVRAQLEATVTASRICAEECEQHAEMHRHCRICAAACRNCEKMCRDLLSELQGR